MNIFNRRNALVGYIALKALKRKRKKQQRNVLKIAAFVVLGIVSVGILAALVAVAMRRNGKADTQEPESDIELDGTELDAAMPAPVDSRVAE